MVCFIVKVCNGMVIAVSGLYIQSYPVPFPDKGSCRPDLNLNFHNFSRGEWLIVCS